MDAINTAVFEEISSTYKDIHEALIEIKSLLKTRRPRKAPSTEALLAQFFRRLENEAGA